MSANVKTVKAICPDCEEPINLGTKPILGEKFTCPNCWAYLELFNLSPVRLDWDEFDEESEMADDFDWPDEAE